MKRIISLVVLMVLALTSQAAFLRNVPLTLLQPNGDTLRCYATGDEYYQRLHDALDYTIIKNIHTGYYVYANRNFQGELVATSVVALSTDLAADKEALTSAQAQIVSMGIQPGLRLNPEAISMKQKAFDIPAQYRLPERAKTSGTNHGVINNIVIFIRFSDDSEISTPFSTINAMFNDSTANSTSMYQYFKEASYNKLFIPTYYYPAPNGNTVISVQDSFPRSYYCPYDSYNTNGYTDDDQRREREFSMLERAVNYVNANSPIPTTLDLDYNNDGTIDNICFIVKGTYTGWSDLLWPHKWSLYDRYVQINGKRVYTFNLQLEGSGSHYFSSSTLCHEMFHTLGAPDLYHYSGGTTISPAGSWDLMGSNTTPPQHMSSFMKYKYGNWFDSIPEITASGTYTLSAISDQNPDYPQTYKIASQDPNQWFIVEYRNNNDHFEAALAGSGLLCWRLDTRYQGGANFDSISQFDELYLFRPDANNYGSNGSTSRAYFSQRVGRSSFSEITNPHPWLTNGTSDTTFSLSDITVSTDNSSCTFNYVYRGGCVTPENLRVSSLGAHNTSVEWSGRGQLFRIACRPAGNPGDVRYKTSSTPSTTFYGLTPSTTYEWAVKAICSSEDSTDYSDWHQFSTISCDTPSELEIGAQTSTSYYMPFNTYYNYSYCQQIYLANEIGSEGQITSVSFLYDSASPNVTCKNDCAIYLAHTSQSQFTSGSNFIPFSNFTRVYGGNLNVSAGWNTIGLSTPFNYNGTDNLVLLIVDSSGSYETSQHKFATASTSNYMTIYAYNDNNIPNTSDPTNVSTSRKRERVVTRFYICQPQEQVTVTALSDDESKGTVEGGGSYDIHATVTLLATPAEHYNFSHWTTSWNEQIDSALFSFSADSSVTCTAFFTPKQYRLNVNTTGEGAAFATVEGSGDYDYLSQATLQVSTSGNAIFSGWSDGDLSNPRTVTIMGDTTLTAIIDLEVGISEADRALLTLSGNTLTITGCEGHDILVSDVLGRTVFAGRYSQPVILPHKGVYIVRIGEQSTQKVVVR